MVVVRCFCPSCHEKRALEKAGWVAEHVCAEVPHRQFVFTIPKRLRIWEQEVFALLLREGRITEEVVQNIRSWKHSGFSVDQSVRLEAGDAQGIQRLIQYFLRCPFSQARLIEVTKAGKVIYNRGSSPTAHGAGGAPRLGGAH